MLLFHLSIFDLHGIEKQLVSLHGKPFNIHDIFSANIYELFNLRSQDLSVPNLSIVSASAKQASEKTRCPEIQGI